MTDTPSRGRTPKNVLFLMFDQLRFDYLSCYGHPHLHTPHIDALAARGVRFTNAYVQSPVCGASRMSFYTGRYVSSHGAAGNNFPLKVGEITLGDHLRAAGMGCHLIGKTHMKADADGMARLGLAPDSVIGARVSEAGFDVAIRDDGLWSIGPEGRYDPKPSPYEAYLRAKGYSGENPWSEFANAGVDEAGDVASGFFMTNARRAANIREEDSETPWLTGEAIAFVDRMSADPEGAPWLAHVSYIKPHWPYIAPAPYHDMYTTDHVLPAARNAAERQDPHPVYAAFMDTRIGRAWARADVREAAIPAYMGLVKQCDDQVGRLMAHLETAGLIDDTVIVITSDHGDYLGDHWLGEKDLFHQPSVKVPLIVVDPSSEADASRGSVVDAMVESIDLAATFIEMAGAEPPSHIVEGRSLMPFLRGESPEDWREWIVSEYDYSAHGVGKLLDADPRTARLFFIADRRFSWTFAEGFERTMLFDRREDPDELRDLGLDAETASIRGEMAERLAEWARRPSQRTTISDAQLRARREGGAASKGVLLGVHEPGDVAPEFVAPYSGRAPKPPGA